MTKASWQFQPTLTISLNSRAILNSRAMRMRLGSGVSWTNVN